MAAAWLLRCAASSGVSSCQPRIDLSTPYCSCTRLIIL